MKRWGIPAAALLLLTFCLLSRTAINPEDYTGEWYSSQEQCIYRFQEGMIYCSRYSVPVSESDFISGAYTFSGKCVFLFAKGIDGLEEPRELYLVENREESLLCENKDGTGKIFFIRDNRKK